MIQVSNPNSKHIIICFKFDSLSTNEQIAFRITCNETGEWSSTKDPYTFRCSVFGGMNVSVGPSVCGRDANFTYTQPWHAIVFERNTPSSPFKFKCGGTLINPGNLGYVIVTAEDCLLGLSRNKPLDFNNLRVSMGLVCQSRTRRDRRK